MHVFKKNNYSLIQFNFLEKLNNSDRLMKLEEKFTFLGQLFDFENHLH